MCNEKLFHMTIRYKSNHKLDVIVYSLADSTNEVYNTTFTYPDETPELFDAIRELLKKYSCDNEEAMLRLLDENEPHV